MTPRGTVDAQQQIAPSRGPLPAQRWGLLPTEQFWALASFTPISLIFWIGAAFFYEGLLSLGWAWWQNGLGCLVFTAVWAGLVERWSRKYLVRRHLRALQAPDGPLDEAWGELIPSPAPPRTPRIFATVDFWDYAFERWFGRAKGVASMLFEFVFFMAVFYPSWQVFVGSFALLVGMSLGLRWWQRHLLKQELEAGAQAAPALPETCERPPRLSAG